MTTGVLLVFKEAAEKVSNLPNVQMGSEGGLYLYFNPIILGWRRAKLSPHLLLILGGGYPGRFNSSPDVLHSA